MSTFDKGKTSGDIITKVGEGSMANIFRVQIADTDVSLVYKVAKMPVYDRFLKNEFTALSLLNAREGVPSSCPVPIS